MGFSVFIFDQIGSGGTPNFVRLEQRFGKHGLQQLSYALSKILACLYVKAQRQMPMISSEGEMGNTPNSAYPGMPLQINPPESYKTEDNNQCFGSVGDTPNNNPWILAASNS